MPTNESLISYTGDQLPYHLNDPFAMGTSSFAVFETNNFKQRTIWQGPPLAPTVMSLDSSCAEFSSKRQSRSVSSRGSTSQIPSAVFTSLEKSGWEPVLPSERAGWDTRSELSAVMSNLSLATQKENNWSSSWDAGSVTSTDLELSIDSKLSTNSGLLTDLELGTILEMSRVIRKLGRLCFCRITSILGTEMCFAIIKHTMSTRWVSVLQITYHAY
jgi:hypothetical protein